MGGASKKPSLREQAEAIKAQHGFPSRIDKLMETMSDQDRADVMDLLMGEPLLGHMQVAKVLESNFGGDPDNPILDRNVLDWRRSRGIKLRGS